MFVRFRQSGRRLHLSIVENRRVEGQVKQTHVASLGSVELPLSAELRLTFWQRLHERLARLDNRIDQTIRGKILAEIHNRVPMVTIDEQRALQLEAAASDERFWTSIGEMNQATAEDHKRLAAAATEVARDSEVSAADAASKAGKAKDHIERIKSGEDVVGLPTRVLTLEDYERILGKDFVRHCRMTNEVSEAFGFEKMTQVILTARDRAERVAVRDLHRLIVRNDD